MTFDNGHDKAAALTAAANDIYDGIRRDKTLSAEGRVRKMAPVHLKLRKDVAAVEQGVAAAKQTRIASLTRTAFGAPRGDAGMLAAWRDAGDRARRIDTAAEAGEVMKRALELDDSQQAQAVAERALELGWTGVVEQYTAVNPRVGDALAEIDSLAETFESRVASAGYFWTPAPDELKRFGDGQLEELAGPDARA